jgi:hypothetical protein
VRRGRRLSVKAADGRDDPGRIAAQRGHVGERDRLGRLAQGGADQVQAAAGHGDQHGFGRGQPVAYERAHLPGVFVLAAVEERVMGEGSGLYQAVCRDHGIITSSCPSVPGPS